MSDPATALFNIYGDLMGRVRGERVQMEGVREDGETGKRTDKEIERNGGTKEDE